MVKLYSDGVVGASGNVRLSHLLVTFLLVNIVPKLSVYVTIYTSYCKKLLPLFYGPRIAGYYSAVERYVNVRAKSKTSCCADCCCFNECSPYT